MNPNIKAIIVWSIAYAWAALLGAVYFCFLTLQTFQSPQYLVDDSAAGGFCQVVELAESAFRGVITGIVGCSIVYIIVWIFRAIRGQRSADTEGGLEVSALDKSAVEQR